MTITATVEEIKNKIKPLLGQKCWHPSIGHGSFITLEFGQILKPSRIVQKGKLKGKVIPPQGEWHLWVYMSFWEIWHGEKMLVNSESLREELEKSIKVFDNKIIKNIELSEPPWITNFIFEDGYSLKTYPYNDEESDHQYWMLFCPDDNVLTLGYGGNWSYQAKNLSD